MIWFQFEIQAYVISWNRYIKRQRGVARLVCDLKIEKIVEDYLQNGEIVRDGAVIRKYQDEYDAAKKEMRYRIRNYIDYPLAVADIEKVLREVIKRYV